MPRVRWRSILWCSLNFIWISCVSSDCWFENQKHKEGEPVKTTESCLNCTCTRGTLVCYLRVCPKLPNPPQPNCIILHRHKTCCPELICTDSPTSNTIEARSDTTNDNFHKSIENACIENGTVYGPGSAMVTSRLCEYCYCIGGQQTCIKPKCLLTLDGCTPIFEKHNCCPIRYNCTGFYTSTTTETPKTLTNYCIVNKVKYSEGSKISGAGHSICDSCYCIRGLVRCEPLVCAPTILGCTPVIKPGTCCPDSYNCNGTFNIQPDINYNNYPIVSKDYAKLRKEVQRPPQIKLDNNTVVESEINKTTYVIADSSQLTTKSDKSFGETETTRHLQDPSTTGPFYYNTMNLIKKMSTKSEPILDVRTRPSTKFRKKGSTVQGTYYGTTNYEFQNTSYKRPFSTTIFEVTTKKLGAIEQTTNKQVRSSDYENDFFDIVGSLFDNEIKKDVDNDGTEAITKNEPNVITTGEPDSINLTEVITTLFQSLTDDISTTVDADSTTLASTIDFETSTIEQTSFKQVANSTAVTTIVTTTDCIKNNFTKVDNELDLRYTTEMVASTEASSGATTESDYTEVDLESKLKVDSVTPNPHKTLSPDIEALLNITMSKNKDYEDYDYNEPTLPPSLPNLRIIPFVAADALDTKSREKENLLYPDRITQGPPYSLFSPPTKTEGGFVPKEPPIMPEYYEEKVGMTTERSKAPLSSGTPKTHEHNCISNGQEVIHRDTVTIEQCTVCVCFYGNMICQQPPCPVPEPGCIISRDTTSCCPQVICDTQGQETDRIDITSNSQDIITLAEHVETPNPFQNVIRTERPPNLQSLIEGIQLVATTEKTTTPTNRSELSFGSILDLLLYEKSTTTRSVKLPTTTETPETIQPNNSDLGVGLLKLAGCNIYGRMYRVGRIISELSGPCMECRCTEIGVQCIPLKC